MTRAALLAAADATSTARRPKREWIERVRAQLERVGAHADGERRADRRVPLRRRRLERRRRVHGAAQRRSRSRPTRSASTAARPRRYYNELPYARQVAELFGTDHHEIVVQPDVVALLPQLLWHMDEPIADTAFITTYLVSEFARRDVTVILSGVGGDELFGGYRRYLGGHYAGATSTACRAWAAPRCVRRSASALPSDRHSPLLNALRLAKGFLATAGAAVRGALSLYVAGVRRDDVRGAAAATPPAAPPTRSRAAFAGARRRRRAEPHAARRCRRRSCPTICCCSPTR